MEPGQVGNVTCTDRIDRQGGGKGDRVRGNKTKKKKKKKGGMGAVQTVGCFGARECRGEGDRSAAKSLSIAYGSRPSTFAGAVAYTAWRNTCVA